MPTLDNFSLRNYSLVGFDKDAVSTLIASGSVTSSTGTGPTTYRFENQNQSGTTYFTYVVFTFPKSVKFILLKRSGLTESLYARDIKNSFGNPIAALSSSFSPLMSGNGMLMIQGLNYQFQWQTALIHGKHLVEIYR